MVSSPSGWKEEELLLKIDGEIRARNPNLEVGAALSCFATAGSRRKHVHFMFRLCRADFAPRHDFRGFHDTFCLGGSEM